MTVLPFPTPDDASAFDPSTVRILTNAFEEAWVSLQTSGTTFHADGHAQQAREILARCIIEVAKLCDRDQRRLRDAALAHLDEANIRKVRE
jgi:hypothetical protein